MIKDPRKRKKILQEGKKNGNITFLCKKYGISRATYYRWKARLDAGKSLDDRSRRPKKLKKAADSAVEAEVVQQKKDNPELTTRNFYVRGLNNKILSHGTVWKILKKHGIDIRKVIPVQEILHKLRYKKETLNEKENRALKKGSYIYKKYGEFLEKDRGMKLMGTVLSVSKPLCKIRDADPFDKYFYIHFIVDCETLIAFVAVGDRYTISRNATLLLKHVLNLMARKGRIIRNIVARPHWYEKDRLKDVDVDFSENDNESDRLLSLFWGGDWNEFQDLRCSKTTGQLLGVVGFIREMNRTKIDGYPLMGDSPLEAWKKLTKNDRV